MQAQQSPANMGEKNMNEPGLTSEEKLCLQRWFRQAIAKLEQDEVAAHLMENWQMENAASDGHREPTARRRMRSTARRTPRFAHQNQLIAR